MSKKKVVKKKVGYAKKVEKELPPQAQGKAKGHDKIEERQAQRDAKTLAELNRLAESVKTAKKKQNWVLVGVSVALVLVGLYVHFYG